jgi:hypothetical protein
MRLSPRTLYTWNNAGKLVAHVLADNENEAAEMFKQLNVSKHIPFHLEDCVSSTVWQQHEFTKINLDV